MATPFRKSAKWYFSDRKKITEAADIGLSMGIEGGGKGGNRPIIFSALQEGPIIHHEGVATTIAADGCCIHFGGNECNKMQQLTM